MIINQFLMEISKKENKPEILEAEVGQLVSDEEIRKCQPDQLQEPLEEITDFLPENKASDNQTLNDQEKIVSIPIPEEITTICQPKSIEITNKENESQINLSEQKVVQPITPIPEQLRTSPEQPKKPISEQPKTSTPEQPKISTPEQPKTSTPKQKKEQPKTSVENKIALESKIKSPTPFTNKESSKELSPSNTNSPKSVKDLINIWERSSRKEI